MNENRVIELAPWTLILTCAVFITLHTLKHEVSGKSESKGATLERGRERYKKEKSTDAASSSALVVFSTRSS
jgi:hypothetical protein